MGVVFVSTYTLTRANRDKEAPVHQQFVPAPNIKNKKTQTITHCYTMIRGVILHRRTLVILTKQRAHMSAYGSADGSRSKQNGNIAGLPSGAQPELRESVGAILCPTAGGDGCEDDVSQGLLRVAVLDASGGGTFQEAIQVEVEPVRAAVVDVARVKNLWSVSLSRGWGWCVSGWRRHARAVCVRVCV